MSEWKEETRDALVPGWERDRVPRVPCLTGPGAWASHTTSLSLNFLIRKMLAATVSHLGWPRRLR